MQGCASDSPDAPEGSETLFVNGDIYIDADHKVDNILVRDGIAVGINVNPAFHPRAQRVNLEGAAAYPGFNDSHVHLNTMAVAYVDGDLTVDAMLSAIEAVQQKNGALRGKHTLYHLGLITNEQIARMSALGDSVTSRIESPPCIGGGNRHRPTN